MSWYFEGSFWSHRDMRDILRMQDDGGLTAPEDVHVPPEIPTQGVQIGDWGDKDYTVWRIYSCERCGWYVWHPISYCQQCPGRMRVLKGYSKDLKEHMEKHGYKDGGF